LGQACPLAGDVYAACFEHVQPALQTYLLVEEGLAQAVPTAPATSARRWAAAKRHLQVK
jgi:hypothetical protein